MMVLDRKKMAGAVLKYKSAEKHGDESEPTQPEDTHAEGLRQAAHEVMNSVHGRDPEGLMKALHAFHKLASGPGTEQE